MSQWSPENSKVFEYGHMSERHLRLLGGSTILFAAVSEKLGDTPSPLNLILTGVGVTSYIAGEYIKQRLDQIEQRYETEN